jgi:hypothetical protein
MITIIITVMGVHVPAKSFIRGTLDYLMTMMTKARSMEEAPLSTTSAQAVIWSI